MTLYYPGQKEGPFGWATCNRHLSAALANHFTLTQDPCADVGFYPIADHEFNPCEEMRASVKIGYAFFEFPLGAKVADNAKRYDLIFVGSTWCQQKLAERGIASHVLIQGVEYGTFKPAPCLFKDEIDATIEDEPFEFMNPQFRVFSGGKFEWRKGQDLVIRAFAEFAKEVPEAHLVTAWFNPWPFLVRSMVPAGLRFPHGDLNIIDITAANQCALFDLLLTQNGIPHDRCTVLPQLTHSQLAQEMRSTDVGLFPNRCEGGTNLVLMEYAACGRKVVANAKTGHRDIAAAIDYVIECNEDENGWAFQTVPKVLDALRLAYQNRHSPRFADSPRWTWADAAEKVAMAISERYVKA